MTNYREIEGNATLCFEESGNEFQGIIHAKDGNLFALYGKKSTLKRKDQYKVNNTDRRPPTTCECEISEDVSKGVSYDIKIVDCEDGDEFNLRRVYGRNGDNVTLRSKSVTFITTQLFRGQRADMETQRVMGHTMVGEANVVYKGPIKMMVKRSPQKNHPWVL